jgi:hypothetical protein
MSNNTLSLNVIFHGLCVFVARKTGLEVLLPDLSPEHVFRAGVWLAETNIQRGATLTLEGVAPGNAIFERRKNLMVLPEKSDHFPRSSAVPYATIALPRPGKIYSLRPVVLTPGVDLIGSASSAVYLRDDGKVWQSTVQALHYDVRNENRLALANHRWIPAFVNGVANLHIFAEPETPQPIGHSITEFGEGSAMFQGLDLRRARASIVPEFDAKDLPPGICSEELEDLIPRTKRMGFLGRYKTSGEDPGLAWDDQDLFGGDPTACVWGIDGS